MTIKDGVAYLQAGGGIVFDSVEEDEYVETINKLSANMKTIDMAEGMFSFCASFIHLKPNAQSITITFNNDLGDRGVESIDGTKFVQGVIIMPNVKTEIQGINYVTCPAVSLMVVLSDFGSALEPSQPRHS